MHWELSLVAGAFQSGRWLGNGWYLIMRLWWRKFCGLGFAFSQSCIWACGVKCRRGLELAGWNCRICCPGGWRGFAVRWGFGILGGGLWWGIRVVGVRIILVIIVMVIFAKPVIPSQLPLSPPSPTAPHTHDAHPHPSSNTSKSTPPQTPYPSSTLSAPPAPP